MDIFEETQAACLCRPQTLSTLAQGAWSRAIASARHSRLGHNPGSDIYQRSCGFTDPRSAGAAYRREVFEQLGGYDERFDACEDVEFNHRVAAGGYRSYRHADLNVSYQPRTSISALFRQLFRYGRGRAHLVARHPSAVPWALVTLSLMAVAWIALAALNATFGVNVGIVGCALYAAIVGFESLRTAGIRMQALRVAASLTTIHLALLLGFWRGLIEYRSFVAPQAERTSVPD